jgi:hypothetical protein
MPGEMSADELTAELYRLHIDRLATKRTMLQMVTTIELIIPKVQSEDTPKGVLESLVVSLRKTEAEL